MAPRRQQQKRAAKASRAAAAVATAGTAAAGTAAATDAATETGTETGRAAAICVTETELHNTPTPAVLVGSGSSDGRVSSDDDSKDTGSLDGGGSRRMLPLARQLSDSLGLGLSRSFSMPGNLPRLSMLDPRADPAFHAPPPYAQVAEDDAFEFGDEELTSAATTTTDEFAARHWHPHHTDESDQPQTDSDELGDHSQLPMATAMSTSMAMSMSIPTLMPMAMSTDQPPQPTKRQTAPDVRTQTCSSTQQHGEYGARGTHGIHGIHSEHIEHSTHGGRSGEQLSLRRRARSKARTTPHSRVPSYSELAALGSQDVGSDAEETLGHSLRHSQQTAHAHTHAHAHAQIHTQIQAQAHAHYAHLHSHPPPHLHHSLYRSAFSQRGGAGSDIGDNAHMWGWILLVFSMSVFVATIFAIAGSKLLPAETGMWMLDAVVNDDYYGLLVPLTLPVTMFFIVWNWMGMKYFRHN